MQLRAFNFFSLEAPKIGHAQAVLLIAIQLRKPLAYPNSERLMYISSEFSQQHWDKFWVSPPEYLDYKDHTRAFADLAARLRPRHPPLIVGRRRYRPLARNADQQQ